MAAIEVPFGRRMRSLLRDAVTMLAVLVTFPAWGLACLARRCGMSDRFFLSCGQTLSLFPGMVGIFLRRGFYLMCVDKFGRDCCVEFGTYISHPEVSIGMGVYIGGRCTIGKCSIGDHALIGSNVDILSGRHQHRDDDPSVPRSAQGGSFTPIRIGANTWLGNSSVVMADVGDGSIIGAGSVVVKAIPSACVAAGNPAVVKRTRGELNVSLAAE